MMERSCPPLHFRRHFLPLPTDASAKVAPVAERQAYGGKGGLLGEETEAQAGDPPVHRQEGDRSVGEGEEQVVEDRRQGGTSHLAATGQDTATVNC
jgi:hypothetical protein